MYLALVIIFTLLLIGVIIFCVNLKPKKRHKQDNDDTFVIGKPKGPNNKQKVSIETQTTDIITTTHTGPKGERGLPGLPFQLNDCGNLLDGTLQEKVSNLTIPFYYYAVSKDLRSYRTELEQDMSYHLICYTRGQWFDLGPFTSLTIPPPFLNVRSYDIDQSLFQVPDNVFYIKYKLCKQQTCTSGIMDVHPGQTIKMIITPSTVEIENRNPLNSITETYDSIPRIILWY